MPGSQSHLRWVLTSRVTLQPLLAGTWAPFSHGTLYGTHSSLVPRRASKTFPLSLGAISSNILFRAFSLSCPTPQCSLHRESPLILWLSLPPLQRMLAPSLSCLFPSYKLSIQSTLGHTMWAQEGDIAWNREDTRSDWWVLRRTAKWRCAGNSMWTVTASGLQEVSQPHCACMAGATRTRRTKGVNKSPDRGAWASPTGINSE